MRRSPRNIAILVALGASLVLGFVLMRRSETVCPVGTDGAEPSSRSPARVREDVAVRDSASLPVDPRIAGENADPIAAALRTPLILTGTIEEARGAAPEQSGATCRLGVERLEDRTLCRVVLECGHTRLHGAPVAHETACSFDDQGALLTIADASTTRTDRDPSLEYARDAQTLTVRDDLGSSYGEFALVVRIDEAAPSAGVTR
jgi:hypothetical protein